jgi:hypothetical protein
LLYLFNSSGSNIDSGDLMVVVKGKIDKEESG